MKKFHRGKVHWHHPIEGNLDVGLWLCEAHHSILMGRKRKYWGEVCDGRSIEEVRQELKELEAKRVREAGLDPSLINKC